MCALAVSGADLYAGGYFTTAGGVTATNVAKWDGDNWSALGSGTGGGNPSYVTVVSALAVSDTAVYAAGNFSTAGGKLSPYLAAAVFEVPSPVVLQSPVLRDGVFTASFTNTPGFTFTSVGATKVSVPPAAWSTAGSVTEVSPGQFQFTDLQATNGPCRYYHIRWP